MSIPVCIATSRPVPPRKLLSRLASSDDMIQLPPHRIPSASQHIPTRWDTATYKDVRSFVDANASSARGLGIDLEIFSFRIKEEESIAGDSRRKAGSFNGGGDLWWFGFFFGGRVEGVGRVIYIVAFKPSSEIPIRYLQSQSHHQSFPKTGVVVNWFEK